MKTNIEKIARKDAERLLAADMFYGDGAGTRRKLLNAEIDQRLLELADTDYPDLLRISYDLLDKNKFAQAAIRERKNIDRAAKAGKNFRALRSGNFQNLTNGVAVVVVAVIVAKQTGLDKEIKVRAERLWHRAKVEYTVRKESADLYAEKRKAS